MHKPILLLAFLTLVSLFQNPLFSYEYPVAQDEDIIILALNHPQMESLYSRQNYSIAESPRGVCYGIDRVNYTLLTKVQFEPGEQESEDKLVLKLLLAFLGLSQTISGYDSTQDFIQKMEENWDSESNPLKRTIEILQLSQDHKDIANQVLYRYHLILKNGEQSVVHTEAKTFSKYLLKGIPLHIAIFNPNFGSHALTIVGLRQNVLHPTPMSQFYVLDSNLPDHLQILSINKKGQWKYAAWENFNAQTVSLMWKEPSESEVETAQATFRPHFLLGRTSATLLAYILQGNPHAFPFFLSKR